MKKSLIIIGTIATISLLGSGGSTERQVVNTENNKVVTPVAVPAPTQTKKSYVNESQRLSDPVPVHPVKAPGCNPNYSGCLKSDASDYDCQGGKGNGPYYTGTVQVLGVDEYGLDRDGDGIGCDS